jgi:prophage regulatory protein
MTEHPRGRFLRMPQVAAAIGLSAPTINRMHRQGEFPPKVRIGAQAVGWWESEIEAWKASRARVSDRA